MDYINHITSLCTNKHVSYAESFFIEQSLHANMAKSAIATVLGRSRTTIYSAILRGIKDKQDEVIISLLERKTRTYVTWRSPSAKSIDIKNTLLHWLSGFRLHEELASLCKTTTADNGLEVPSISELETEDL